MVVRALSYYITFCPCASHVATATCCLARPDNPPPRPHQRELEVIPPLSCPALTSSDGQSATRRTDLAHGHFFKYVDLPEWKLLPHHGTSISHCSLPKSFIGFLIRGHKFRKAPNAAAPSRCLSAVTFVNYHHCNANHSDH